MMALMLQKLGMGTTMEITIESSMLTEMEVKGLLEAQPEFCNSGIKLELRTQGVRYRGGPDPTVLVAIVGLTGSAISALISGLLQIVQQRTSKKIVIESGDRRLEIPVNTHLEKIDQYVEIMKQMDADRIILP